MTVTFIPGPKTVDGKDTHIPHAGFVPQTKKQRLGKEVIIPAKVGPDDVIIPAEEKNLRWRGMF